jgi:hypothetical protein
VRLYAPPAPALTTHPPTPHSLMATPPYNFNWSTTHSLMTVYIT